MAKNDPIIRRTLVTVMRGLIAEMLYEWGRFVSTTDNVHYSLTKTLEAFNEEETG